LAVMRGRREGPLVVMRRPWLKVAKLDLSPRWSAGGHHGLRAKINLFSFLGLYSPHKTT